MQLSYILFTAYLHVGGYYFIEPWVFEQGLNLFTSHYARCLRTLSWIHLLRPFFAQSFLAGNFRFDFLLVYSLLSTTGLKGLLFWHAFLLKVLLRVLSGIL